MNVECLYCGATVHEREIPPAVDDDNGWTQEAEQHAEGCEWVATRAHRLEA